LHFLKTGCKGTTENLSMKIKHALITIVNNETNQLNESIIGVDKFYREYVELITGRVGKLFRY